LQNKCNLKNKKMVKVIRTDKEGNERVMTLEQKVWDKMVKKPHLVPGMKWRLWVPTKPRTTRFVEVPIDAEVEIKPKVNVRADKPIEEVNVEADKPVTKIADIRDKETDVPYGDKEYRADLALAKKCVAEDGGKGAKEAFERALKFKPKNPYIKGQLKKL